jgi:SHS2 domain-containing protein
MNDHANERPTGPTPAGHETLEHTADAGLRATSSDLGGLFVEAAAALAELAADVAPEAAGIALERIELEAADLVGLAYGWLNELIGLADIRRAALAGTSIDLLEEIPPPPDGGDEVSWRWRLIGSARFVALDDRTARSRLGVKSATYHGLRVDPVERGWTLTAYLDV